MVYDFVGLSSWVKIVAKPNEVWSYTSERYARPCSADGDLLSPLDLSKCITAICPRGGVDWQNRGRFRG